MSNYIWIYFHSPKSVQCNYASYINPDIFYYYEDETMDCVYITLIYVKINNVNWYMQHFPVELGVLVKSGLPVFLAIKFQAELMSRSK